jgi:hypothetical protein
MSKILELYEANKTAIGIDKISFAAGENAKTPYTTNDLKKADDQVLNAAKLKVGRGGELNAVKYSDSVTR